MIVDARDRVLAELGAIDAGDARLKARSALIAERLIENPDASFPAMMATDAELEAFYRFTNNDALDVHTVLAPHVAATHAAARMQPTLVVHDTTECHFSEHVHGMGFIGKHPGFLAHTALAVSATAERVPLGVMGVLPLVRPKRQMSKKTRGKTGQGESARWLTLIERVEAQAHADAELIHVLDREGDVYSLLSELTARERRFVVRAAFDRRIVAADDVDAYLGSVGTLWKTAFEFRVLAHRDVEVCKRDNTGNARKRRVHASRDARVATLAIRAGVVRVPCPQFAPTDAPRTLELAVVYAHEDAPPDGEEPIDWMLLTSEPIATAKDALSVIDFYRGRWRIEEFFKALKTGCAFEKRQSESLQALLVVLGLLMPVAWQMLALRSLAHDDPNAPATAVLRPSQLDALVAWDRLKTTDVSVRDALLAIARIGGHLKRNGDPGWITLGRGIEKLLAYEAGYLAGRAKM
jgi:hypothetical protein